MIVKQIISRMWGRLKRSGLLLEGFKKHAGQGRQVVQVVSHLGSGALLKKKLLFVFCFEQRRKSRDFPESKSPQELVLVRCGLSGQRSVQLSTRTL